jgi:DNA-binding IclR family transcriptional regulator
MVKLMNIDLTDPGGTDSDDKVPAVTKAIAIIRHINQAGPSGVSLIDISVQLGITKSHCFNILKGLARAGWLLHDDARRTYMLSTQMLSDISSIFGRGAMSTVIHEELDKLSTATRLPCILTRVERDGSFVAIDRSEAAGELLFTAPIGFRFVPDAPAQMRVRLAYLDAEDRKRELAKWVPVAYTSTTIVDRRKLLVEIEATRARGYAISRAEYTPGVMTLAAPIFDAFGNVQMILQCPGLATRVIAEETAIARKLLESAARLNGILGNSPKRDVEPAV